ncbi:MAG: fibronectin type III domain-containing protein, partial [Acidobacteriota bacterium]
MRNGRNAFYIRLAIVGTLMAALGGGASWLSALPQKSVPAKPFDLRAKIKFEGATAIAALTWRDQSDNELGFEVLRSDDAGKTFKVVGMVGANTTRHQDKVGKYVSGAYQYQVRAFNEVGKSEPSNVAGA